MADAILVNSRFTQGVFGSTFPRLRKREIKPAVLYPAVRIPSESELEHARNTWRSVLPEDVCCLLDQGPTFVSINRFERKKGIDLAIKSLDRLLENAKVSQQQQGKGVGKDNGRNRSGSMSIGTEADGASPCLIIAGGYDNRLAENVEYLEELRVDAERLSVIHRIAFLPSFSDAQRAALLARSVAVLYTPPDEHFGIVPLEAMAAGVPVIACNSGGPLESVLEGRTGFLRPRDPDQWAAAMRIILDPKTAWRYGQEARRHVKEKFSRDAFGRRLNEIVISLASSSKPKRS